MLNLNIPIPDIPGSQDIEIDMKMNGRRQQIRYRIEIIEWRDCRVPHYDRVDCLRDLLKDYDEDWVIYNIGVPTDTYIPLTFIKKEDWAAQHQWIDQYTL